MTIHDITHTGLILAATVVCLGCGGSDRPERYTVTGEVVYQGAPVEGAQVMFMPADARQASGSTDSAGKFELTTFDAGDGAVAGMHDVTISKMVQANPNDTSSYPELRPALPPKYSKPGMSGLKAEVTPDAENHFRFELTN